MVILSPSLLTNIRPGRKGAMTLSIMTFRITIFSIMTISIMDTEAIYLVVCDPPMNEL